MQFPAVAVPDYRAKLVRVIDRERYDELAGKYEFDALMSREAAEARAFGDVMEESIGHRRDQTKTPGRSGNDRQAQSRLPGYQR